MAPEATLPHGDVNVPGDYFSLAGFEVIMHGRFWVLTEDEADTRELLSLALASAVAQVKACASVSEAMAALRRLSPDLINV